MAVQLQIPYDTLLGLVEQLQEAQKHDLLRYLLQQTSNRDLTVEEKLALYHASIQHHAVNEAPSLRREDWYDDDGR